MTLPRRSLRRPRRRRRRRSKSFRSNVACRRGESGGHARLAPLARSVLSRDPTQHLAAVVTHPPRSSTHMKKLIAALILATSFAALADDAAKTDAPKSAKKAKKAKKSSTPAPAADPAP